MDINSLKEQIKERVNIVELISEQVLLKKRGVNYVGLCPFHNEKTPSFTVNPQKKIFNCFGCGSGGDIVTFTMKQDSLSYIEAINKLAMKAGFNEQVSSFKTSKLKSTYKSLLDIQKYAMEFYKDQLSKAPEALQYIETRGIFETTANSFHIGYALERWDELYKHLLSKGYKEKDLAQSGILVKKKKGFYDSLRGRIVFPIFDSHNEPIAFGGRIIREGEPKYLNSAETPIYKKKSTLYGLNFAKNSIKSAKYSVIVEGYMDVIMCHQYGITNAVAPLGTTMTQEHLKELKKYSDNVLLVFDADLPGIQATKKSLKIVYATGFEAKTLLLPEGNDPDSFLRNKGKDGFIKKMEESLGLIDFMLKVGGKTKENLHEIVAIISSVPDKILKSQLTTELSEKARLPETILREMTGTTIRKTISNRKNFVWTGPYDEELLLILALNHPNTFEFMKMELNFNELKNPIVQKSFNVFVEQGCNTFDRLVEYLEESELICVSALLNNPIIDPFIEDKELMQTLKDCINKVKKGCIENSIKVDLCERIKTETDEKELNRLLKELMDKKKQLLASKNRC